MHNLNNKLLADARCYRMLVPAVLLEGRKLLETLRASAKVGSLTNATSIHVIETPKCCGHQHFAL